MKFLYLIRHAKSSWDFPLKDFDRPLTSDGVTAAKLVAKSVKKMLPSDYTVWSSSAKRASDTAIIFCETFDFPLHIIRFKDDLYTFNEVELERIIKKCEDNVNHLILFGHNEAITNFVNKFGTNFIDNVPTAGFVALKFEQNQWNNIDNGVTIKTIFPRDLK